MKKNNSQSCCISCRKSVIGITLIILWSSFCAARPQEQHYLLMESGIKIDIEKINRLAGDSLYFTNIKDSMLIYPVDSIAEYHEFKSNKVGKGIAIGAAGGLLMGGLIGGALFHPSDQIGQPYNGLEVLGNAAGEAKSIAVGAVIGLIAGGTIGGILGINSGCDVNIYFKHYTKNVKMQLLAMLVVQ